MRLMLFGLMMMILLCVTRGISPSHIISRSNINRGRGGRSDQRKRLSHYISDSKKRISGYKT